MTLNELDQYFNSFLKKENFCADPSLNGIQIQNSEPDKKQIKKVAFAVDACEATALEAAKQGADVLFVHHGLFWGGCQTVTGSFYKRIASFIKNDLALIAYHIPLDANVPYGNNAGLAERIGLKEIETFGEWRGMKIGLKGKLPSPLSIEELSQKVLLPGEKTLAVLPFGKKEISTVGVVSGGASEDVEQAIEQGLDAYITGEASHELYHYVEECAMNMICAGHYQTETLGVNLVKEKLEKETGISCIFIDIPTKL
jgi:dinuclear metal center YbgI/SA1388 family protein